MDFKREVDNIEDLEALKLKCLKCKIILLEKQGKHPLSSLATFTGRHKRRFLQELDDMIKTMTDDEIDREFNEIVCDSILSSNSDVSLYSVVEKTEPDHSVLYRPVEPKEEIEEIEEIEGI